MNIKNLKRGMKVRISKNISITESHFDACRTMRNDYAGTIREISSVYDDRVYIGNYMWHPDDLQSLVEPKEKTQFIFDENELVQ